MLRLPKNGYDIRQLLLQAPVRKLLENMKLHKDMNTKLGSIFDVIFSINDRQEITKNLLWDILSEMKFKPSDKNDAMFDSSFEQWKKNPLDLEHLKRVECDLNFMKDEYNQLHDEFVKAMEKLNEIRENIDKNIVSANAWFYRFFRNADTRDYQQIIDEMQYITMEIYNQQNHLLSKLCTLIEILQTYNAKRFLWAEYVIGMRETLSSKRHSLAVGFNTAKRGRISKMVSFKSFGKCFSFKKTKSI